MRRQRSRELNISNTLLVFASFGMLGDPSTVNKFEMLDYQFPRDQATRDRVQAVRDELRRTLTGAERQWFIQREREDKSSATSE